MKLLLLLVFFPVFTPPSIMAALKVVSYGAGFVGIIAQNVKLSIDEFRDETIFNVKADWRWIETDKHLPWRFSRDPVDFHLH